MARDRREIRTTDSDNHRRTSQHRSHLLMGSARPPSERPVQAAVPRTILAITTRATRETQETRRNNHRNSRHPLMTHNNVAHQSLPWPITTSALECSYLTEPTPMLPKTLPTLALFLMITGCNVDVEGIKDCKDKDGNPLPEWVCRKDTKSDENPSN